MSFEGILAKIGEESQTLSLPIKIDQVKMSAINESTNFDGLNQAVLFVRKQEHP